jgi:hypothetical protein
MYPTTTGTHGAIKNAIRYLIMKTNQSRSKPNLPFMKSAVFAIVARPLRAESVVNELRLAGFSNNTRGDRSRLKFQLINHKTK